MDRVEGKKGSDLNFNTQISLEEAFRGTTISIKIPKLETCSTCFGQGQLGENTKCRACKGQAKLISEKTFNINIPPGINDGERLCMEGEGEAGLDNNPPGDLYVNVFVRPHPMFQREENDLYYTANIKPDQLGQNIKVFLLDGQTTSINIPSTANNETIIPITAQGMPIVGQTERGNLYIRIRVTSNLENLNNPNLANYQAPPKSVYQSNLPYTEQYQDPRLDSSRSPYNSPTYYPQQNMQIQNLPQYPLYGQVEQGEDHLIQQIKTSAMVSFALSVLSLFCLGIFIGPVSFFLSRKALRLIRTHNLGTNYRSWAIVGQVLSIFSFILSGLVFLMIIFDGR